MFLPRLGCPPTGRAAGNLPLALITPLAALSIVILGGCAKSTPTGTAYVWPGSAPYQVAAAPPPRPAPLEEDGREAQPPPLKKAKPEPDDPTEPWSPNYGSRAPTPAAPPPRGSAAIPDDLPPAFRRRLAEAVHEQ